MSRSSKKGPYIDERLLKRIADRPAGEDARGGRTPIKTYARASTISPEMVGTVIAIHTGNKFAEVLISEEMVGHKLGEFALTKKFIRHGGRLQREAEAAAAGVAPVAEKKNEDGG